MFDLYDITDPFGIINNQNTYRFVAIGDETIKKFENHPNVESVTRILEDKGVRNSRMFPHNPYQNWNTDFFGPIYIPEAGKTIDINLEVLPMYKRVITEYEQNDLRIEGNQIYINDVLSTTYTFKQDYYWMMGDNRHNSIDARFWGFVPFDHIVGKPVFIWMSINGINDGIKNWSVRWDRVFTTVHGSGKRISYLIPFLVLLLGWYGFNKWRKRKK